MFSSSAAVYGTPDVDLVTEATADRTRSRPYGESKLIGEWLLADQGRATGLRHTSLRYFNVVGSATPDLYDTSPHNLFPLVLDALAAGRTPRINGDRLRDARRHLRPRLHPRRRPRRLARRRRPGPRRRPHASSPSTTWAPATASRCGEIMTRHGRGHRHRRSSPRSARAAPGDPARIVASGELAARDLDWQMRHTLLDMVTSAWEARQAH